MTDWNELMTRLWIGLTLPRERDERGDVPGWVLITVMSAGIVAALYTFAKDELRDMLRAALNQVS